MNDFSPEDLARALFEEAGDALFLFDPDSDKLLSANAMAERLTGFSRQELLRFPATELFRFNAPAEPGAGGAQRLRSAASHTGIFHSQEGYGLRTRQEGVWVPVNISIARLHVRPRTLALMTARDVREQRAAHDRLLRVEAEMRRVLASVSDGIWSGEYDGQGGWAFRYLSPVMQKITGRPPEFFLEKFSRWRDIVYPADRTRWEQSLVRLRKGQPTEEEYRLVRPDGKVRWVRDSVRVSRVKDAPALRFDGVLTDLTESRASVEALQEERRRAAEALQRERNLLRTLIDNLPDHVFIKDPQSCFVTANVSTVHTLGAHSEEEVLGKCDFDFLPRERAEQYFADEQYVVSTGEAVVNREELVPLPPDDRPAGSDPDCPARRNKWCLTTKLPLRDAQGAVIGLVGISRDITERKEAEEERTRLLTREKEARAAAEAAARALQASEAQYRSLAEAIPQLVWTAEPDGQVQYHNRRWFEYTGLTPEDCEGLGWAAALHPEDRNRCLDDWATAVRTGRAYEAEYRFRRASDETYRWHLGRALPIVTSDECQITKDETGPSDVRDSSFDIRHSGRVVRWFGTFTDIDDQKRASVAMQQAKEAAESANRAKSEFLANVSHEIRTPMNGIIGMTELALDTEMTVRQREYLTLVKSSSEALLTIINDILDFSKIEAGKLELDPRSFPLRDSLGDALKALAQRAHAKDLELACHIAPGVPDFLVGDPTRLRQIVVNLVGNAIKFTRQGEVVVNVELQNDHSEGAGVARDSSHCALHFEVRDTGIGIPANRQEQIFQAFEQGDGSTTREFGGTGLGLAISSRLVEMMAGRIWVESEPDHGSVFHFLVPFGLPELPESASQAPAPGALEGLAVLVVDDNATNRLILEEMLLGWRMRPTLADSAAQALELLEQAWQKGEPFGLVLVDVHMPQADGFSLVEHVRKRPGLAGAAVMMLTSGGRPGDLERCRELDVRAYLTKPVKQSDLFDRIVTAIGQRQAFLEGHPATEATQPTTDRRPLRVLLAEDNLVNQTLVVCRLEQRGDTVKVAGNGREALAAWEGEAFDVILMDVQMPEVGGFEATTVIRQREQQSGRPHTPIIALTAHAMKGDRERCLAAGMDDYVAKPLRVEELFRAIDTVTGTLPGDQPAEEEPDTGAARSSEENCVLEREEIRRRVGGNKQLLRAMIKAFFEESPRLLNDLRAAVAAQDAQRVRRIAHTLKSDVGTFGARAAFETAKRLEEIGRDNNLTAAEQAYVALEECIEQMRPALDALAEEGGEGFSDGNR